MAACRKHICPRLKIVYSNVALSVLGRTSKAGARCRRVACLVFASFLTAVNAFNVRIRLYVTRE